MSDFLRVAPCTSCFPLVGGGCGRSSRALTTQPSIPQCETDYKVCSGRGWCLLWPWHTAKLAHAGIKEAHVLGLNIILFNPLLDYRRELRPKEGKKVTQSSQ